LSREKIQGKISPSVPPASKTRRLFVDLKSFFVNIDYLTLEIYTCGDNWLKDGNGSEAMKVRERR
jgi:hypothetical protein